jgi:hypothetical protein
MTAGATVPRVYVLIARSVQSAIIFRRGSGKNVAVLRWDIARDVLEEGHWLSGRIYERRCDLTPSGEYLVYFAAKFKGPYPTYTAVSRPPWLTALALWRGHGTWGGGGYFQDDKTLLLNRRGSLAVDEGRVHARFSVASVGPHAGFGEDNPLWHSRMLRDGWTMTNAGTWAPTHSLSGERATIAGEETRVWWRIDPPMTYRRVQPHAPHAVLEMRIGGLHEIDGPWYATEHVVLDAKGRQRASLGRTDWADWDALGDLLFARDGRIHRVPREHALHPQDAAREVFDLRAMKPVRRISPPWAREWLSRRPRD